MNEKDLQNLILVNRYAKSAYGRIFSKKLCYFIKTALLKKYARLDGYDQHIWYDFTDYCVRCGMECFGSCKKCVYEHHAVHQHILERYDLSGVIFHSPTEEFYYYNFEYGFGKESKKFGEYVKKVKVKIEGKKEYFFTSAMKQDATKALKELVKNYKVLLHASKEVRTQKDWNKIGQNALF